MATLLVGGALLGCSDEKQVNKNPHNTVQVENQLFDSNNDVPYAKHEWKPFVYGQFYRDTLGEQVQMDYEAVIEAILNGDTEVYVSNEFMVDMFENMNVLFPPYYFVVEDTNYQDGLLTLTFTNNREKVLDEFGSRVVSILDSCICEGDSDLMKAIAIYNYLTPRLTYDYSAVGDVYADVTSFRGLTEYSGICQSFAGAYTYLCLQEDIDATVVVAVSDKLDTHEWSMINIDGQYYYVDPTFDAGMSSMMYFGFTKEFRADYDDYPIAWQDIGGMERIRGDVFDGVSDTRFDEFRKINYDVTIVRSNGQMIITGKSSSDQKEYSVIIE